MRTLPLVKPTPEQLKIFSRTKAGVELIRGAAGSGKTTTALLKLRSLIGFFQNRKRRANDTTPVQVLVLTYNRTLRGYIEELARLQSTTYNDVILRIETFGKWAKLVLGNPTIVTENVRVAKIGSFGAGLLPSLNYLVDEVDYILGRFRPDEFEKYLTAKREGRGASPRVDRALRRQILDLVVKPYETWKSSINLVDWNDLAVKLAKTKLILAYDIVIADETQDFTANQIRAIMNQVRSDHSVIFVLDSAQRIYARGFTWQEVGVDISGDNSRRLKQNYRNTIQIARLAASLVQGLPVDDDGTLPDFSACTRNGNLPIVLQGRFGAQMRFTIDYIKKQINLQEESVAFLHPKGGGWFSTIRKDLTRAGLSYVEISRQTEWPQGAENIALSTLHSAKGLEFDHVVIIGLNAEVTVHGDDEEDDQLVTLRRLLAMGIGRARHSVILGYKPTEASHLISYLDPKAYQEVKV
jgi:superfamily I DNA/RNA helicase